jgi:SAM-dependent methyltransferase
MEEIYQAIQTSELIMKALIEGNINIVISHMAELANIVERSIKVELLWSEEDLKRYNAIMKYILLSIENNDFNFGAYVIQNNLVPLFNNIKTKATTTSNNFKSSGFDETTNKIKDQYTEFAYPNFWKGTIPSDIRELAKKKNLITALYNLEYIEKSVFSKYIPLNQLKVLIAGCGTGESAITAVLAYPSTDFTFVDISSTSLKLTSQYLEELKIKNVEISHADIMTMDLEKKFDIIISTGVIHHLSNPSLGVANLNKHLEEHGVLSAMVYGEYGRFEIGLFQEVLKTLMGDKFEFNQGIELVKMIMNNVDGSKNRMTNILWKEDLNKGEQHIVDLLLNVNEHRYDVKRLNKMLNNGGMSLLELIPTNTFNPSLYVKDKGLKSKFNGLPYLDQCSIAELINGKISTHNFYAVKTENSFNRLTIDDLNSKKYYLCKSPYLVKKIIIEGENRKNYISVNPTCVYEENNINDSEIEIDDILISLVDLCNGKNKIETIFKKLKGTIDERIAKDFIRDAVNRRILILVS